MNDELSVLKREAGKLLNRIAVLEGQRGQSAEPVKLQEASKAELKAMAGRFGIHSKAGRKVFAEGRRAFDASRNPADELRG